MSNSEWRVTSQYINGTKMFAAYRLRDKNAVDHAGNREYSAAGYCESKEDTEGLVEYLNEGSDN